MQTNEKQIRIGRGIQMDKNIQWEKKGFIMRHAQLDDKEGVRRDAI